MATKWAEWKILSVPKVWNVGRKVLPLRKITINLIQMRKIIYLPMIMLAAASCSGQGGKSAEEEPQGAFYTGVYHNYFSEVLGVSQEEVDQRMDDLWKHFFTPGDFSCFAADDQTSVYYEVNDSMAYIYDTGSDDVRTEGMSYGMMICVQLDKPQEFDKLWRWAKTYMRYPDDSPWSGYFNWQCHADGTPFGNSNASDGEAYFATALFLAAHRWDNKQYEEDALDILRRTMTKDCKQGVWNLYDSATHVITFVPTDDAHLYTDPSYQLPAFTEMWARWDKERADFWTEASPAARRQLRIASHPVTGLYPDYSTYEGVPFRGPFCGYDSRRFQYDAIRCTMNVGMDYYLFGADREAQRETMKRILSFFKQDGFTHGQFEVDGSDPTGNYTIGMTGANAVGSIALEDGELKRQYIEMLWNARPPQGKWRYYEGMVYMLSMLHVSGNFRIY